MDPDILAMVTAAADTGSRRGASDEVLQRARAASAASRREQAAARAVPSAESTQLAAMCIPGVASLLTPADSKAIATLKGDQRLSAMCKLAVSPKIRGSGTAVEKVRRLQNMSTALVSKAALHLQAQGLAHWLRSSAQGALGHRVLGFSAMWDEASQRLKMLLTAPQGLRFDPKVVAKGSAPKDVQVFVAMGTVHLAQDAQGSDGSIVRVERWQPWLAPPLFLSGTTKNHVVEALARALPADLTDKNHLQRWCERPGDSVIFSLCFDFASSNVAAFRHLVGCVEAASSRAMLHGERCATHCIHLVKAHTIAASEHAGVLYCVSKLMQNNRTCNGVSHNIANLVRSSLRFDTSEPPPVDDLASAVRQILGVDGDCSLMQADGDTQKWSPWFAAVMDMVQKSRFDANTKKWVYYHPNPRLEDESLVTAAVEHIGAPLFKVFVARRWEVAALSRWTGVMNTLKRMALGVVMNSVLPQALGGLSGRLGVTQSKLDHELEENRKRAAAGLEVDDTMAKNMSRTLRVSKFFGAPSRQWQVGVTLISVSVVDRLHWAVLGARGRRAKANLTDMVDPAGSVVARALSQVVVLLDGWSAHKEWALLKWFSLQSWEDEPSRRFARTTLLRLAAGLFARTEKRFAAWPYKLQLLLSDATSVAVKDAVATEFCEAPDCCLGPFGRAFRKQFPTPANVRSSVAESVLRAWQTQLRFTTAPVECEHKRIKDDCASLTSGATHAPVAHRAVCRHLHQAHVHRGGPDVSLPLRRKQTAPAATATCWPDARLPLMDALDPSAEDAPGANDSGADDLAKTVQRLKLGGGNPKIVYMNFHMHQASQARQGKFTKAEVAELRSKLKSQYDASPELQARWRVVYDTIRRSKANKSETASSSKGSQSGSDLWPGHMQLAKQGQTESNLPITEGPLKRCQDLFFKNLTALEDASKDGGPYSITTDMVKARSELVAFPTFGCAAQPHNACRPSLAKRGLLRRFDSFKDGWNQWVRTVRKEDLGSCGLVCFVAPQGSTEEGFWLLIADVVYNPFVQTFAVCRPVGQELDATGKCPFSAPVPPFDLEIVIAPSRLCHHTVGNFLGVRHMTSDELLVELAESDKEWEVRLVEHTMRLNMDSLRFMTVTSLGAPSKVESKKKARVSTEDAFLEWARLMDRPAASSSSQRRAPSSDAPASLADDLEDGVDAECAGMDEQDLEALLESIMEAQSDDGDDEVALGCQEPQSESAGSAAPEPQVAPQPAPEASADVVAVVAAVAEACDEPKPSASSSSGVGLGDDVPPAFPECGYILSSMGYVRCNRAGHDPERVVGLVGYKTDGKSIFANCHMHSVCSVSAGIMRQSVPREHMAEWLCLGVPPPPGATTAQRKALGVEHRKLWARPGA